MTPLTRDALCNALATYRHSEANDATALLAHDAAQRAALAYAQGVIEDFAAERAALRGRVEELERKFDESVAGRKLAQEQRAECFAQLEQAREALGAAAAMLSSVAGDIEDGGSFSGLRGKYVLALIAARDDAREALASLAGARP